MPPSNAIPDHLIHTKLYPPRVPEQLVLRANLLARLHEHRDRPLTLISAPAGYGKSTLAYQWMKANTDPFTWLSLDEYDSRLESVADYLIAALGMVYPEIGHEAENLLQRPQLPDADRLANGMLRDLQNLSHRVYLVIDDFHTITHPDVSRFLSRLLQRLPDQLRIVIVTRSDPPLPLAQLRGRGQLQEIRGGDLRFTAQEAVDLFAHMVGPSVDSATVSLLADRAEGWPLGLRLVALSMRETADTDGFVQRFITGGNRTISDYLLNEVLDRLPNEQRRLLLCTAVSDRICAPLVDALAVEARPETSGHTFLQQLWSANFFLIALDDQGEWYRYHHLFRQLLLQQLHQDYSAEAVNHLNLLASRWFETAGYIEEAIIHAVRAGEAVEAARIVERHVHEPVNREEWRTIERWVRLLPEEAHHSPGLLATQAMIAQFRARARAMRSLLEEADRALLAGGDSYSPREREAWVGVIDSLNASGFIAGNSPQKMLSYAGRALQRLDPTAAYIYSLAEFWQIYALQMEGRPDEGLRIARERLSSLPNRPNARTLRIMLGQCAVLYGEADIDALRAVASMYLQTALRANQSLSIGWSRFMLGWCAYQENQLDAAAGYFTQVLENRFMIHVHAAIDSFIGLVLIQLAKGQDIGAAATLEALRAFVLEQGPGDLLLPVDSLVWRLPGAGTHGGAIAGMDLYLQSQLAVDFWEQPVLTASRMDIAYGRPLNLAAAGKRLAACHTFARSRNNKRLLIQIAALQALLHEAQSHHDLAVDTLRAAVLLAEPGGTLRYFADLGPTLVPLLRELQQQGVAAGYIERILHSCGETASSSPYTYEERPGSLSQEAAELQGELTNREMEVLLLLGERLTNKEIAEKLHVSPETIKKYTVNLYQKLDVANRRQAVARSLALGILTSR